MAPVPQPAKILQLIFGTDDPQVLVGMDASVPPKTFVLHRLMVFPRWLQVATKWDGHSIGILGEVMDFGVTFAEPHTESLR